MDPENWKDEQLNIEVSPQQFTAAHTAGAVVIDVRGSLEYMAGHVPDALHIPLREVDSRLAEVPAGRVYVICASGQRSLIGAEILRGAGRDAWSVAGGTAGWKAAGGRVVRGSKPA
ncbi:rhodanese-like domain-containing protein [Longispora sp. NPDC051575]|uniref:rhodanese-like domain-containing protein n=1 Tax=Longispora sp. NPDC051575 TaxID=3154943 RepID=UPI00344028DC